MILGPSHTGKTSLCQTLHAKVLIENDGEPKLVAEGIENKNKSGTTLPVSHEIELNNGTSVFVWDTPGFGDSR